MFGIMLAPHFRRALVQTCVFVCAFASSCPSLYAWWEPGGSMVVGPPARPEGGAMCSDGAGGAIVAWSDWRDSPYPSVDVYAHHLLSDGTLDPHWPSLGTPLRIAQGIQYVFDAVSDGAGGAIVVWMDTSRAPPDGNVQGNLYAIRIDSNGSIHSGWSAEGQPVDTATFVYSGSFSVCSDDAGGIYAAWEDQRTGNRDIRAQHVLGNGQVPAGWPADGLPVCTAAGDQWTPALAPDGSGGVFVCWSDFRGVGGAIYAQHLAGSGLPFDGWPVDGLPVRRSGPAAYEGWNIVISDGFGGAYFAWIATDGSGAGGQVRMQRLRADGMIAPGWPSDATLVSSGQGAYLETRLCLDGSGGVNVCWEDSHLSTDPNQQDIFASRLTGTGSLAPGFLLNGRPVCTFSAGQWFPRIAPDGSGGIYVAWSDERDYAATGSHVFGSHLNGDGRIATGWPTDGLLLSRSVSSQMVYEVLPDGTGGALAFWGDYDLGADDIRALRMVPEGVAASAFVLTGTKVAADYVTLHWRAPSMTGYTATIQRYRSNEGWLDLGSAAPGGDGVIVFTDTNVEMGASYVYRLLVVTTDGVSRFYGTASVTIPLQLRMQGPSPNPSREAPVFEVTFATGQPARFDLFDIAGRSVWSQDLTSFGPGTHLIRPGSSHRLAAGIYVARFQADGQILKRRLCLLH